MSETTAPVTRSIAVNGKTFTFVEGQHSARSKEKKGRPLLLPQFVGADGKTPTIVPSVNDLSALLAALGADALLKAFAQAVLAPLVKDASDAATKEADGKFTIDNGDFARELVKASAEFTQAAAKLDDLRKQEAALNDEINRVTGEILAYIGKQQTPPASLVNQGSQLLVKRAELMKAQAKKSGSRGKKAEATPAPAAK